MIRALQKDDARADSLAVQSAGSMAILKVVSKVDVLAVKRAELLADS